MGITDRLDAYLEREDLTAVWFARPNSFAWLTGGGDNVVDRAGDVGVAAAGYDGEEVTVVTDTIEAPRLVDEELPGDATVKTFPWHESSLAEAVASVSPSPAAADFDVAGFDRVDATSLRQPLTDEQVETYDRLATEVAESAESVLRDARADDSELSVAADLYRVLEARDVTTPVVLVGGGERAQRYRHYTPTEATLGDYALASVTAERDGLFVSCTRTVAFDVPDWLPERTHDAMRVEATALAATQEAGRHGGTAGEVFAAVRDAYAELDWEGEWANHHQGGAAGYAGREWIATPDHDAAVRLPMAYSWNPTIQGAKSEDLHLVTADDVRPMTDTGDWPMRTVTAVGYDFELERSAPLQT